jgi:hypothetical protein
MHFLEDRAIISDTVLVNASDCHAALDRKLVEREGRRQVLRYLAFHGNK